MSDNSGGMKFDGGKPDLSLIPYEATIELAHVMTFGKNKYGKFQWKNGFNYSRLISAALRHIYQFNEGEDFDPESGNSHLAHAMANLSFLIWMQQNKPELDDRYDKSNSCERNSKKD